MNKLLRSRICHLLSILKIHNPDCEHCKAKLTCGLVIRKRLEELDRQDKASGDSGRAAVMRKKLVELQADRTARL